MLWGGFQLPTSIRLDVMHIRDLGITARYIGLCVKRFIKAGLFPGPPLKCIDALCAAADTAAAEIIAAAAAAATAAAAAAAARCDRRAFLRCPHKACLQRALFAGSLGWPEA